MRVAVIGAGNVGSALARACLAAGHEVVLSSRHPEHAQKVAGGLGARAAASNSEAVDGVDMVMLAVPSKAVASIIEELRAQVEGKILIDPTNPVDADVNILRATGSVAEGIRLVMPQARVVKAFNTVFANRMADPVLDGVPLDGFYAGDDVAAKAEVAALLAAIGFRPLDVGDLDMARALELMAYVNITLNARNSWPWQSGWKLLGPTG